MHLRILTPERTVVDVEIVELLAPGAVGQMGVLPDHITFLGTLATGELRYHEAQGKAHELIMSGGVVEVVDNEITILADAAMAPGEIQITPARKDLDDAETALQSLDPHSSAHSAAVTAREWARLRIDAVERAGP